jgi:hypothetical protein
VNKLKLVDVVVTILSSFEVLTHKGVEPTPVDIGEQPRAFWERYL